MVKPGAARLSSKILRVNATAPIFVRSSIVSLSAGFDPNTVDKSYEKKDAVSTLDRTRVNLPLISTTYLEFPGPEGIANIGVSRVSLASDLAASINREKYHGRRW